MQLQHDDQWKKEFHDMKYHLEMQAPSDAYIVFEIFENPGEYEFFAKLRSRNLNFEARAKGRKPYQVLRKLELDMMTQLGNWKSQRFLNLQGDSYAS